MDFHTVDIDSDLLYSKEENRKSTYSNFLVYGKLKLYSG